MAKTNASRSTSSRSPNSSASAPVVESAAVEPVVVEGTPEQTSAESAAEPSAIENPSEQPEAVQTSALDRQQPISPPSEALQFRAIGLVQGKYIPSKERFNRGLLEVDDNLQLDAVLLGQVMSLVKKYIDLDRPYLWVVYPRTREKEQTLHLQIVGVWSADGFSQITDTEAEAEAETPTVSAPPLEPSGSEDAAAVPIEDGYFSIRGQVVYQSQEKQLLYVKIQQAARKTKARDDRGKAFKLKINGSLPQKAVGYFWDLQVYRQGNELMLRDGTSIAPMPVQKSQRPQKRPGKPFTKPFSMKPNTANRNAVTPPNRESRSVPKPVKRTPKEPLE